MESAPERLVTLVLAVELVKVTAAPVAFPLDQPAEVPDAKTPPAASFNVFAVLMAAALVALLIFAKALAIWLAVAPELPT
jgi:hypothetical protein